VDLFQKVAARRTFVKRWYEENQLTELPEQNREQAEEMIEKYNME
jgi:hypothetical protein